MREAASVRSIEGLGRFRAALGEFGDVARLALSNADAEVRRIQQWLQHDQVSYWQQQIRRRNRAVAEAKSELYRAELGSRDERPSCAIERKRLDQAQRQLAEAEEKIQRVRQWQRVMERESMQFRGQTAPLAGILDRDLPRAVARLEQHRRTLESYVKIAPPTADQTAAAPAELEPPADDSDEADAAADSASPEEARR